MLDSLGKSPGPLRRTLPGALLCAAFSVGLLTLACGKRQPAAGFDWRLSQSASERLDPVQSAALSALLAEWFGTALAPRPRTPAELLAQGVDLAAPALAQSSADLLAAVRADNALRFGELLDRLAAGEVPRVPAELAGLREWFSAAAGDPSKIPALVEAVADFRPPLATSARTYANQCLSCHGREGGGDGPAAAAYDPRPRDLRLGRFQYLGLLGDEKPRTEDLVRLLHAGVPGTAMPSFRRMSTAELAGLADYVRLLAVRGELERLLLAEWEAGRVPDSARAGELLAIALSPWIRGAAPWSGASADAHSHAAPAAPPEGPP